MLGQFCKPLRSLPNRLKFTLAIAAVGIPAALTVTSGLCGVRLNLTNSVPIGFYVITTAPDAKFVEFCLPEPFGTLSVQRGYRERSRFGCPDGAEPLLKPVAAKIGDVVVMSSTGMLVDGAFIPHTAPLRADTAGRPISSWPFGVYAVRPDTIWVASSFNTHSFDSRYFGPIATSSILHRLRPLWTSQ